MVLVSTIPTPGSSAPALVKKDENTNCCVGKGLHKCALIIGSLISLALGAVFTAFIILGCTHFSIVLGLVISLVLTGVMLASLYCVFRRQEPIPQGFLSILKQEYPGAIYDLIVQERLTIQELRAVLLGLSSGAFTFPSTACQKKVMRFGLERLQKACEGIKLPDLDKLLLKSCPYYLVNKFIQLGPKEFPAAEKMDPEDYWLSNLALVIDMETGFNTRAWILSKVISRSEYETLLTYARNDDWEKAFPIIDTEIYPRLHGFVDSAKKGELEYFGVDKNGLHTAFGDSGIMCAVSWLLLLCKHGVSWEQLQLVGEADFKNVAFLRMFNATLKTSDFKRLILSIYPYLHEDSKEFEPSVALLTWEEIFKDYEKIKEDPEWRQLFYDKTMKLLKECRGKPLIEKEYPVTTVYRMDLRTGARRNLITGREPVRP